MSLATDLNVPCVSCYRGAVDSVAQPGFSPPAAAEPEREDARLVAAVVAGEREALAALYDRHASRLAALVTRVVGDAA